jgi:hypothetical protein
MAPNVLWFWAHGKQLVWLLSVWIESDGQNWQAPLVVFKNVVTLHTQLGEPGWEIWFTLQAWQVELNKENVFRSQGRQ